MRGLARQPFVARGPSQVLPPALGHELVRGPDVARDPVVVGLGDVQDRVVGHRRVPPDAAEQLSDPPARRIMENLVRPEKKRRTLRTGFGAGSRRSRGAFGSRRRWSSDGPPWRPLSTPSCPTPRALRRAAPVRRLCQRRHEMVDVAVRFGNLADSSLRVRKLSEHRRLVCAAPSYVKSRGKPKTPADLETHNCIVMR